MIGERGRHDETGLTSAKAEIHRARREIAGDLSRRRRQRVQQGEPHRRLQRCGEPLGQGAGVFPSGLGGHRKLMAESVDIRGEIHDAIVAQLWRHSRSEWLTVAPSWLWRGESPGSLELADLGSGASRMYSRRCA